MRVENRTTKKIRNPNETRSPPLRKGGTGGSRRMANRLKNPRFAFILLMTAIVACGASAPLATAADPSDDDDAPVAEGPAKDDGKREKTTTKPAPSPEDEELLKAVVPHSKNDDADEEIDRLERAIEGMRRAQERITRSDTSPETQKIQERVIKDLEDLLSLLKKQQKRRGSSQQKSRQQSERQSEAERQRLQKEQGDPNNSSRTNPDGSADPNSGRRTNDKSVDSQERTDAARTLAAEQARRARMIKDVWGHLPPHVRERIEKSFSEKYLPKYEELVKKYYESLAEKNRKSPQANDRRK